MFDITPNIAVQLNWIIIILTCDFASKSHIVIYVYIKNSPNEYHLDFHIAVLIILWLHKSTQKALFLEQLLILYPSDNPVFQGFLSLALGKIGAC